MWIGLLPMSQCNMSCSNSASNAVDITLMLAASTVPAQ